MPAIPGREGRLRLAAEPGSHSAEKGGGYRRFVGLRGVSDILGILPQRAEVVGEGMVRFGNLLAVEVKRPGEKPRPEQTAFLEGVNGLGGVGLCVHSVGELEARLRPFLV